MIGAIIGDIIGSRFEWANHKSTEFELFHLDCDFTDDSVLTIAMAESILTDVPYVKLLKQYTEDYPNRGYGGGFRAWAESDKTDAYNSFGNGAAMRTSPAGWTYDTIKETVKKAEEFAAVTHNHPEGIKGAQATAAAIFMARTGETKDQIRSFITGAFGYDLETSCDKIRPDYKFDETCQGTVPQALVAFFDSHNFEHAIRLAVSLGGDTDTLTCITGGIAQAYYGYIPLNMVISSMEIVASQDDHLFNVIKEFNEKFVDPKIIKLIS